MCGFAASEGQARPKERQNMTRGRFLTSLVLAALAFTVPVVKAANEKLEGDIKTIQGKWKADENTTYTFKGNKLKVEAPNRTYEITVTLDAKATPDKKIDMKIDEAPEDAKGKTSLGIYKFEGDDKFIFCFRAMGDRPTKFETIGFEQIVVELKRDKK
jgi:uncharacterized protein (TIGR03067 family)